MPYVAPSTKHARLWVDAVAKSLKTDKTTAAQMYARLCDYSDWDRLVQAINRGKCSQTDEQVTQDILETRYAFYRDLLSEEFGMDSRMAQYMIEKASPSSARKPQRFSIDTNALYGDSDINDDDIDMQELFESFGIGSDKEMNAFMEAFAREALGDSLPEDFNFDNLAERLRISRPLDPGVWYDLLAGIGWELIDESFRTDYVYGEESFYAVKEGSSIPVFITSLLRSPSDFKDEMANEVMSVVENHFLNEAGYEEALLFWGQPIVKEIDGKHYSLFGLYYTEGQWREFLMNKDTTISDVFAQHNEMESVDEPPESLRDDHLMLAVAAVKMINGIDTSKPVSMAYVTTKSGWQSLLPSETG